MSHAVYFKHALCPQNKRVEPFANKSLSDLDPQWERPYIALVNGKPVLRKDWNVILVGQDIVVTFVDVEAIPQGGGGGSNPLRIVAMIAVMVVAYYTGQWWMTNYGAGMVAAGTISANAAGAIQAGIVAGTTLVGTTLVNALLPAQPVSLNSSGGNFSASPTYNLQAQGNQARIDGAIPEHFGRHKAFPDFASQPYQEFFDNEQYLYQLFCIGRGHYDIEDIRVDDTTISNFEDITFEVVGPYEQLDLFPANVVTANEVAGNVMDYSSYVGPFAASGPGTQANYIGIDYLFNRGLYYATNDGKLANVTVTATAEARLIDDNGVALGSFFTLGSVSYTKATATPQRFSVKYTVPLGRYEVRVMRTNNLHGDQTKYGEELSWGSLRAYLKDTGTYDDCTLIAMRMKASNQLTSISSRKVNVIATRKLPIWNGSTWSAPVPTRSIAWAAAYCAKQIGLTDQQIDLAGLLALEAVWANRGDTLDGRFDTFISFWEAMGKILAAGRAKHFIQGGVLRFFRDQASTMPTALFNMRNIIRKSLTVQYLMPTEDTADSVEVTYFDSTAWAQRRVLCTLPSSTSDKPAKIEVFGVTSRERAHKEGLYQAASNRYRRKLIKFSTEMEGFLPSFGDLIAVQHDVPAWGQGGEITAWDPQTFTATLSEPPVWEPAATHYIALRDQSGKMFGPYRCVAGAEKNKVVLVDIPEIAPYVGHNAEQTYYTFGWGTTVYQQARVLGIRPRSTVEVEIECINEDPSVHTAEDSVTMPPVRTSQLPNYTAAPVLKNLVVRSMVNDVSVMLLSWEPTPWAEKYFIEVSPDGDTWNRIAETSATSFSASAIYGASTYIRVAAVGIVRGPWVTASYGNSADYMWNTVDTKLMWNVDSSTKMWK